MEAWNYIDKAYELAHSSFTSWHEMAMSYVIGRAIWGGTNAHNLGMKGMADDLLSNPKSPWVQIFLLRNCHYARIEARPAYLPVLRRSRQQEYPSDDMDIHPCRSFRTKRQADGSY